MGRLTIRIELSASEQEQLRAWRRARRSMFPSSFLRQPAVAHGTRVPPSVG